MMQHPEVPQRWSWSWLGCPLCWRRGCDEAFLSENMGFSEKGGGNSVNEEFGKDVYRKGNSVNRSGPFS